MPALTRARQRRERGAVASRMPFLATCAAHDAHIHACWRAWVALLLADRAGDAHAEALHSRILQTKGSMQRKDASLTQAAPTGAAAMRSCALVSTPQAPIAKQFAVAFPDAICKALLAN
eukprot:scaffold33624_cov63-Phaeocystis_antarctica.AAC.3